MTVVVDGLVAWLVGLLGDAGRKGLINLVVGTDLERALAKAAEAAVMGTARQLRQDGGESTEDLARVIGEVFWARGPREFDVAVGGTLLEAIVSGVSAQIAVLGDPELTGQGVSAAEVLGIPAGVIAEQLAFQLIARVKAAALDGGALLPLAIQLNQDEAFVRDMRAAGVLARVDEGVRAILARLDEPSVTVTAPEFADDVTALLERLAEQAAYGRLPSYLAGHRDVLGLTRQVRVRAGIRRAEDRSVAGGRVYALAADREEWESPPQPWPELAAARDRVVVLADPGLGKSWLIRTETHRLAAAALAQAGSAPARLVVPVPLRCDQLAAAEGPDLPTRAASHLAAQGLLAERSRKPMTQLIRAGRAVLLLDALDELTSEEAAVVRALISAWADQARTRARCVITSRIAGYAGSPLPGAAEVELQPFTTEDVEHVIGAWGLPTAAERELLGRAGDPAVAAMARVPLMLAMLCALAAGTPVGRELPSTRGELYERVLRWFLTGAHRGADDPSTPPRTDIEVEGLLQLLAPIAYRFATRPGGWTDLMPSGDLLKAIRESGPAFTELGRSATQILQDLSAGAGILVPDRNPTDGRSPRYLFLHRTFAEFLTARHLANLPAPNWLTIVTQHQWFDPDWRTVIPLLGGQLDAEGASQLITHLLASHPDPFWQAQFTAIAVAGERPDPDGVLDDAQAARLGLTTRTLLGQEFGRGLIREHVAGLTHLPRTVQKALLARLDDVETDLRRLVAKVLDGLAGPTDDDILAGLLVGLKDPEPDVRQTIARALARRSGQRVTAALLASLEDGSGLVRTAAVAALAGRTGWDVTNALLAHLNDPDREVREAAASALANRETPGLTTTLIERLEDRGWLYRETAVIALAGREGRDVTAALIAHFDDLSHDVARALAKREGQDVTAALIAHLDDDTSWSVSIEAARGLAARHGQDVTAALIAHLTGTHYLVRRAIAEALTERKGRDVTTSLLASLDDPQWVVRQAAAKALAGRDGEDVTAGLLARLNDGNWEGWGAAFDVLAERQGQDVTAGLLGRVEDPDWQVRQLAATLLAGRDGQEVTTALLALLDDEDVRETAAESLAGRDGPDVTAALLTLVHDSYADTRTTAARALAGRDGPDVTAAFIDLLDDTDEHVRETAAESLAGREGQEVTAALLALLDDPERISELAPQFVARREGQDVTAALIAHLNGPMSVSWEAATALAGREGQDVTTALLARLAHRDRGARWVASEALALRPSRHDLIRLAQGIQSVPASDEALKAAYQLTTRHYQALSQEDREMIRTTMSDLTSALLRNS